MGVGHGFLGGEGFRRDQEQGGFRVHRFQHFGDMGAIDVRYKVHIEVVFIRTQRFGHHERAEVRTADTDIHYVSNRFTGIAFPATGDDRFREMLHLFENSINFRHHIFAINNNRSIATVAQSNVQNSAIFSAVDLFTGEHGLDRPCQIGLFRQILQFAQRLFGDAVFGKIHQHQIVERCGKLRKTVAVLREKLADSDVFHFIKVFL